jgi:hypothetical protein
VSVLFLFFIHLGLEQHVGIMEAHLPSVHAAALAQVAAII